MTLLSPGVDKETEGWKSEVFSQHTLYEAELRFMPRAVRQTFKRPCLATAKLIKLGLVFNLYLISQEVRKKLYSKVTCCKINIYLSATSR